jgi:hypothetical protein
MIHSSPREDTFDRTINNEPTLNGNLTNARIVSAADLNPTLQQVVALLWFDIVAPGSNSDMSDLVHALPVLILIDKSSNNGHDAIVPYNLKRMSEPDRQI